MFPIILQDEDTTFVNTVVRRNVDKMKIRGCHMGMY